MSRAILITETEQNYQGRQPIPEVLFVEGKPEAETWQAASLEKADGFRTGIWVGQPGKINIPAYPSDEVFTVITGGVTLHGKDGDALDVGPGESCFIPKGWVGVWETREETRKCFTVCNG